jgi:hypothetical protein
MCAGGCFLQHSGLCGSAWHVICDMLCAVHEACLTLLLLSPCCCLQKLGLEGLGYKLRDSWQPQEELLFALGM